MSLFKRRETRAISTDAFSDSAAGFRSLTGDAQARALRLVPVYAAVSFIADGLASLPLHRYRDVNGQRTKLDPPRFLSPTVDTTFDWMHKAVVSLLMRGNAYGFIVNTDRAGVPTEIMWMHPDDVTVDDTGPLPVYYLRGVQVARDQIVHVKGFTRPGYTPGLSPIRQFAETVDMGLYAQIAAADWYRNGSVPSHSLKNTQQTLTADVAQVVKERYRASVRTGEPFVHGADWDISQLGVSAQDAAFLEAIKANATQVGAIFRVPAEKIGGETGSSMTYSTTELQTIDLITHTYRPWFTRLEQVFNRLLPDGEYMLFNADAMIRTDTKTRYEVHKMGLEAGIVTQDEARQLENRPPLTDDQKADWQAIYGKGQRDLTLPEAIQKTYLGVGSILTTNEARDIVNEYGANLPTRNEV